MAITLNIDGVDKSSIILWDTLSYNEILTSEVDTLTFSILKYGSRTFIPAVSSEIALYNGATKLFGGTIVDVDEELISVDNVKYNVTCKDWSHEMDRYLIVERFIQKPLINIVCEILNRYVNRTKRIGIADMETSEIWTGGVVDTTHYRTGDQGRKLTSSNGGAEFMTREVKLDLQPTGWATSDYIDLDIYVEGYANLSSINIDMGDATLTNFFQKVFTSSVTQEGWNHIHLLKSSFSSAGSPSWNTIQKIYLGVTSTVPVGIKVWSNDAGTTTDRLIWDGGAGHNWQADSSTICSVTFDNIQAVKSSAFTRNGAEDATQIVDNIVFNYEYPSKAFQRLAELFAWEWYVDQDKDIHFFAKFDKASAFNLTDTNGKYVWRSLSLNNNYDQLRNSIYVRGGDYIADEIIDELSHQADNVNKIFKLGWRYKNYELIVNTFQKSVGVENLDEYSDNVGIKQDSLGTTVVLGDAAARTKQSQQVIVTKHGRRYKIKLWLKKSGTPSDNVQVQIYDDDGANQPGSTLLSSTATYSGSSLTTSFQEITFELTESTTSSLVFNPDEKYHIVVSRSGANDAGNYYQLDGGLAGAYDGQAYAYNASWTLLTTDLAFTEILQYDALYNYQEKIVTFNAAPQSTDVILFQGQPVKAVLALVKDAASITQYGEFQYPVIDKRILSVAEARQRALQELLAWAQVISEGSFLTFSDGLRTGQTINVQSTLRNINEDYIIKSITATMHTKTTLQYHVELVTTKTLSMIDWMQQQLLKDKKDITISDDETLEKLITLDETISITTSYVTSRTAPKVWSNDAGTTTDRLIWDGGVGHVWDA